MSLWSLLENNICFFCGDSEWDSAGICRTCRSRIKEAMSKKGDLCPLCSQPAISTNQENCPFCASLPEMVSSVYSLSYFNGAVKEILTLYKSGKRMEFCYFLAEIIDEILDEMGLKEASIVPIPPRKGKIHHTGWDQIDLLCRILNRRHSIKICRCLVRSDGIQQKTLNYHDRTVHMKNTLYLKKRYVKNKINSSIILLDDVYTSGATLGAAAGLLAKYSPSQITAIVLCSVI